MAYTGTLLASAGAINSAIGSYYDSKSYKYQLESQASKLKHDAEMQKIQARQYEFQAMTIMESAQRQIGQQTMQAGQLKSSARATIGASGVDIGYGSTAEIQATNDLMKEIDSLTINSNAIMQQQEALKRKQALESQSDLTNLASQSLLTSASNVSPFRSALSSMLASSSNIYSKYKKEKKMG
jgi:hypothetical protein